MDESTNPFEKTKEYKGGNIYWKRQKWVNNLFEKQNACAICGAEENLVPHHIIKSENYERLYYNENNGLVLCSHCHKDYHKQVGDDINPLSLINYVKEKSI